MGKGKKFSAAEKHFEGIIDKERKRCKRLEKRIEDDKVCIDALQKQLDTYENIISDLRAENEMLRKTAGLSEEEVAALVRDSKKSAEAASLFSTLMKLEGGYYL